jgi:Regulator of chromosome condensation (RCC1) repeat
VPNPRRLVLALVLLSAALAWRPTANVVFVDSVVEAQSIDKAVDAPAAEPGRFVGMAPARLLDTRSGHRNTTIDGEQQGTGPLTPGQTIELDVTNRADIPDTGVGAVVINLTAINPTNTTYITAYPTGTPQPTTASLNTTANTINGNLAIVKVGTGGTISLYNNNGNTHLTADIMGWLPDTADFTGLEPARLLDTRSGDRNTTIDGEQQGTGPLTPGQTIELDVTNRADIPDTGVGAVVINLTAINPTNTTYITAYPTGTPQPTTASLNTTANTINGNLAIVKVGTGGTISLYNNNGNTHLTADIMGWLPVTTNEPAPDVVIVDGDEITVLSGGRETGGAVLELTEPLPVGRIVVTTFDDGPYYGQITEVDGLVVVTEEVPLARVIPDLDLSFTADAATGDFTVLRGDPESVVLDASDFEGENIEIKKEFPGFDCGVTESGASIGGGYDIEPGEFVFDIDVDAGIHGIDLHYARIGYAPSISARFDFAADGGATCDSTNKLATVELPTLRFFVFGVPVWITNDLTISAKGKVTVTQAIEVSTSATASAFFGFIYDDDGWGVSADFDFDADFDVADDIDLEATFGLPVDLDSKMYGIAGMFGRIEPKVVLNVLPTEAEWATLDAQVDVSGGAKAELDYKLDRFKFKYDAGSLTVFGPARLQTLTRDISTTTTVPGPTTSTLPPVTNPPIPDGPPTALALASDFGCALNSDSTLSCWGDNSQGQATPPEGTFSSVSLGGTHACALSTSGQAVCWGEADWGAIDVPAGQFIELSTTGNRTCGIRPTQLTECWGYDLQGESSPPQIPLHGLDVGHSLGCGLDANDDVVCWREDSDPGLADGPYTQVSSGSGVGCALRVDFTADCWNAPFHPTHVAPEGEFVTLSTRSSHTCGLRPTGAAECWGQVHPDSAAIAPTGPFDLVSAGSGASCGIRPNKEMECWGQLNNGVADPPQGDMASMEAGERHSCGLRSNGTVHCSGRRFEGQADPPDGIFQLLSIDRDTTCGIDFDDEIQCWGDPLPVGLSPFGSYRDIAFNMHMACVISTSYELACNSNTDDPEEVFAPTPAGDFIEVELGHGLACAIATTGDLHCWGNHFVGTRPVVSGSWVDLELGNVGVCLLGSDLTVTCFDSFGNEATAPEGQFTSIAVGRSFACATRVSDHLECWYPTGEPTHEDAAIDFVESTPDGAFHDVNIAGYVGCATRTNGVVQCWGLRSALGPAIAYHDAD